MAGTRELALRLALRRDRMMLPAWVLGLGLAALAVASSYVGLYKTEASRAEVVRTLGSTPATLALYGRIYADSVGGLVGWRLGGIALALAGLMTILLVTRHTRAEEETGRAELVGAGAVGHGATLAAALIVATIASLGVGVLVTLAILASGLGLGGALALGAMYAAIGLVFGAVAAVTAQVTESARAANGLAIAVLGASYALRASATPARTGSPPRPLGWAQAMRPFAGERWWLLGPLLALAAALVFAATRLAARRDVGTGILPQRPGPARGALRTPAELAWRLQRGALLGWASGYAILGAAFGAIANDIGNVIGDSADVRDALDQTRRHPHAVRRLPRRDPADHGAGRRRVGDPGDPAPPRRGEPGRAEPLLATAVSRAAGPSATRRAPCRHARADAAAGACAGLADALQTGHAGDFPRVLANAALQAPAAWVLGAVALALFGALPRATTAAWGALALCLALAELGPIIDLPQGLMDLSPFVHAPTSAPPASPPSPSPRSPPAPPPASPPSATATSKPKRNLKGPFRDDVRKGDRPPLPAANLAKVVSRLR